ncbi:NfeD family protein [Proteinivorax hydrogeniformans]|uniref:NfeD family protein n=1 Tax=Proteinivorax hydrogeniformans TaxID=1826727 RepID=A0AAU8HWQ5_9FIRM
MKRIITITLLTLMFFICIGGVANGETKDIVYVVTIEDTIDNALPRTLNRAFNEAEMKNADLIILELNTPGGYVRRAKEIRDLILNSEIPVYAYVNNSAISAGAFIALAADAIYMTDAATMGDAEVIAGNQPADEKVISDWDGAMRALAKRNDRDPEIASAMVRREKQIDNLVEAGQLLTLTTSQALEHGYAEGEYGTRAQMLQDLGYGNHSVVEFTEAWAERFARFITSPHVGAIILSIGMATIFIEIISPGFGFFGITGIACFVLFFAGHLIAGLAQWEYIVAFIIGIAMIVADIFAAGFGILGIGGIALIVLSIILTAETFTDGLLILALSIPFTIIILAGSWKFLSKSNVIKRFVLSDREDVDKGYVASSKYDDLLGKAGVAITPLRPTGSAEIDGKRFDVVTEGGYISANEEVKVIKVGSNSIVVKKINN